MAVDLSVYQKNQSLSDLMRRNAEDEFNRRLAERKVAAMEAGAFGGGNDPAAIKIVNDLQAAAEMAGNPNASPIERQKAAHRYNLLNQVAKTFAIDRGMNADVPSFYGQETGMPQGHGVELPPMDVTGQINGPQALPPAFEGLDQGNVDLAAPEYLPSPTPRKTPPPMPVSAGGGVSAIPGYAQAAGGIAATKKGMETQAQKNVELDMNPRIANMTAQEQEMGKKIGETRADLGERVSRMPQLQDVTTRLSALGKLATYTMAGRARDVLMRETGMDVPDAAAARTEYISTVDNEVLPLLRQTFGAQFTQAEGQSLKVTLGDPNKSPVEKDRVLKSFIRTKMETVNSMAREAGQAEPYAQDDIDAFVRGIGAPEAAPTSRPAPQQGPRAGSVEDGYVFLGRDPADPKSWKKAK